MGKKGASKGKQIVGWIKIITLLGMALEKGEGLEIVDPLLVNGADIKTMISNVQSQSEFVLLYDENYINLNNNGFYCKKKFLATSYFRIHYRRRLGA